MKPMERVVAEWILQYPGDASRLSAAAVAEAANVGFGSVIRAVQRAGYREFGALRTALAVELLSPPALGEATEPAPGPDDASVVVVRSVFGRAAQGLRDTARALDADRIERVVSLLSAARQVAVFGAGSVSGAIAQLMQVRLLGAGVAACCYPHANDHVAAARQLGPGDVAVGISQSGDTASVAEALTVARALGAKAVALTAYDRSVVAAVADVALITAISPALQREAATSRVPMLAFIDALAVAVLLRRDHEAALAEREEGKHLEPPRAEWPERGHASTLSAERR
jgi:DNA-binding MurR/RpiR family transcriptional regulator